MRGNYSLDKGSFTNYVSSCVGGGGLGADDANVLSMGLTSPNLLTGRGSKSPIFAWRNLWMFPNFNLISKINNFFIHFALYEWKTIKIKKHDF